MAEENDVGATPEGIPRITVRPPSGIIIPPPPPEGFVLIGQPSTPAGGPPAPPPGFQPSPVGRIAPLPFDAPPEDFELVAGHTPGWRQRKREKEAAESQGTQPAGQTVPGAPQESAPPPPPDFEPVKPWASEWERLTDPREGMFPFNYPATYREMVGENVEGMRKGAAEFGQPGAKSKVKGGARIGLNLLGYAGTPIAAAARSIAGQPIENVTGLPKEYTEFATQLGIPGLGLPRIPRAPGSTLPASPAMRRFTASFSPTAEDARALIREETGTATRGTEITRAELEPHFATVERLPQAEQHNIMNYVDGGANAIAPATPQLRAFADTLRGALRARRAQLQALPDLAQRQFLEDYFPHFWQDPTRARQFVGEHGGGIGPQGSGASLRARTIPTFEEGIAAGLRPLYNNPIDATMRYIMSMDKFIAANRILDEGVASGTVIQLHPRIVGASGRPGAVVGVPDGYVELAGRGGQGHFAPQGWARIYNNWVSRGWEQFRVAGPVYDAIRRFTNGMTQSLLAFSGYHAFTMAEAGLSSSIPRAVAAAHRLRPGEVARAVGSLITSPVRYAYRGRQFRDMYLHPQMHMSAEDREIVDLITGAGGRAVGTRHTLDYQASALGDYLTSFRRARLRGELGEQWQRIRHPGSVGGFVSGVAGAALSNIARTLETINKPLFQHYIPNVKNGVQGEMMSDWLRANPGAGHTEKLAAARRIVDSVDNRFGEMIQDNIFWNRMLKQSSIAAMLSYSWNVGGVREIGGGMRDIARTAIGRGTWTPKASYTVSTAMTWVILNSLYQKAKTGKWPTESDTPFTDMIAGRTGGVDFRTQAPERVLVPGIMKDVFGYYTHPVQEVINKLNVGMKMAFQAGMNANWRDDPVFAPKTRAEQSTWDAMPEWISNLFSHVANTAGPISFQNIGKREEGTGLSGPEQMLGIRTAPRAMMDPNYEQMILAMKHRRWQGKLRHESEEKARFEGGEAAAKLQKKLQTRRQKYQGPQ